MRLNRLIGWIIFLLTPILLMAVVWVMQPGQAQAALAWQQVSLAKARNQPGEAAAGLERVLEAQPWRVDLYDQIGSFELAAGNVPAAIAAYENGRQHQALSPAGSLRLAQLYLDTKKTAQSREILLEVVTSGKLDADLYPQAASMMEKVGQRVDILDCLNAWLKQEPSNAHALYRKGVYLALDQPAQAALALEQAVAADQAYANAAARLIELMDTAMQKQEAGLAALEIGRGLMNLSEWRAAEIALAQATVDQPDLAEAWAFLAEARQNLGEPAGELIEKALELSPDSTTIQALAAVYWRRQGKPEVGLVYLHAAAVRESGEPYWQIELGKTLVEMNNPQDAFSHFVRATELDPKNAQAWIELARFSLNFNLELARVGLPAARQAVALSPRDARALDVMGAVLFTQNDLASAERFLQQSLQQDATNPDANLHLGQVYLANGNPAAARAFLDEAVRLSPETAVGRLAARLIQQNYSSP